MKNTYINKLEYDKILKNLEQNAITFLGKELVSNLKPCFTQSEVDFLLNETSEAVSCCIKYSNCPLSSINDISNL